MKSIARLCLILAGLVLPLSAVHSEPPGRKHEMVKLADGIYALMWKEPLDSPEPNVLIIINDSDVVVVDAEELPSSAHTVVREIKKLTSKPVSIVINTHWHDDHVFGNYIFKEIWPNVHFAAHEYTRVDAERRAFGEIPNDVKKNGEELAKWREIARTGKRPDGTPASAAGLKRVREYVIPELEIYVKEIPTVKMVLPDLTFTDSLTLYRGSRTIELHYLGLGNTRGDVVVYLPKEKILATGDLVVWPTPFGIGSFYSDWAETLDRLSRIDATTIFLGHGVIQRDESYVLTLRDMLKDMVARVGEAVAQGKTVEECQQVVTMDDWKQKLAGDDKLKQGAFDAFFVQPGVARAYHQAKGEADSDGDGG
ncbi:MAG TPA: MBL fold metallo-hydrolase [archaeon]|nr:MBL fold metallo-hydrolase [archaeon]